jgi:UDP-glucose 4-epimerase
LKYLVTGGAGFIGSNLVDRLLQAGHDVVVYDNFSTGREEFLEEARKSARLQIVCADMLDMHALGVALRGIDFVFHLAANADVRFGTQYPRRDLEQNTIATFNLLEAMRARGVRRIAFSSTGSVYGEPEVFPTPENSPFPIQTSLYGASKLACEGLIEAYAEGFNFQVFVFRFVSILGERYSHGHVLDFYQKLLANPDRLSVLGDGMQRKSYLYIQDCVDALVLATSRGEQRVNRFNLGTEEYSTVNDSIDWITAELGLKPQRIYSGGIRGWVGDSPFIFLDTSSIRAMGWRPKVTIRQGVLRTLRFLQANSWLLQRADARPFSSDRQQPRGAVPLSVERTRTPHESNRETATRGAYGSEGTYRRRHG